MFFSQIPPAARPESSLAAWQKALTVDLRSIAVVRICLGVLLIADLVLRWPHIVAHYSDDGVLPRSLLAPYLENREGLWSFHILFGSPGAVSVLFAVAILFASAFAVGYRTRLSGVVSFLFLCSLQVRNPLVLSCGDTLLRLLLFWILFLPCGQWFSLDSRKRAHSDRASNTCLLVERDCCCNWLSSIGLR